MELLITWISTVITSVGMEVAQELKIFKDIADLGYKLNFDKISEMEDEFNKGYLSSSNKAILELFIPIYNMISVLERTVEYASSRESFLQQLKFMNCIEGMSKFEYEEYQKKPTGLNAVIVPLMYEKRLKNAKVLKIINDYDTSLIYYEIGNTFEDITILKATGQANLMPLFRQKEKVKEAWVSVSNSIVDNDEVKKQIINNKCNIDIVIDNTKNNDNINKINELEELKEQLVNMLQGEDETKKVKKLK